jgi:hypothetical protein
MRGTGIAPALNDLLLERSMDLNEAIDKHFAPDYRQRTDGVWSTRAEFAEHIAHLRKVVSTGSLQVHEELRDGPIYAERHTIAVTRTDGSEVRTEVYVFGECAPDGRFRRIEETTLMLSGSEADRNLGSAR